MAIYTRVVINPETAIDELIHIVNKSGDINPLIEYLADHDRPITPKLREFIATKLQNTSKRKKKKLIHCYPDQVYKDHINCWRGVIDAAENAEDPELRKIAWRVINKLAPDEVQCPETKGEKTKLAQRITARLFGNMTEDQLEERVIQRKRKENPIKNHGKKRIENSRRIK